MAERAKQSETPQGQWIEKPVREIGGILYQRFVVRTHLVRPGERLDRTLHPYLADRVQRQDIVVLGEKIVAIAEGRAVLLSAVRPRPLARFLSKRVRPLGYGLGLRRAETMEMAMREVGSLRILVAAVAGAVDRLVGRSGDFYRVAGRRVAAIDGPGPTTIPPYNQYIVLAPEHPETVISAMARRYGCQVAVVDVNDVGSEVLAASDGADRELIRELLRDNPMGQGAQGTPVAVVRPLSKRSPRAPWPSWVAPVAGGWALPMGGSGDTGIAFAGDAFGDGADR
ncbi:MAG: coenzyme F420-0:L-glutamate ligase [Firmicutes bacterium]|nr:coenzyme F420-0:L-glutamate ligase [Bacillota bacterium]